MVRRKRSIGCRDMAISSLAGVGAFKYRVYSWFTHDWKGVQTMCKLCANFKEKMLSKLCVNFIFTMVKVSVKLCANQVWSLWCCLKSFEACSVSKHQKSQARWGQGYVLIKFIASGSWFFKMCKPCVNQILPCANQKQPCVNCFAPYANPQFSAIPTCFAKPSGHTSYFHVLITCSTFPVQSGEVIFWGQKKFTHFITVLPGLSPDVLVLRLASRDI